MTSPGTDAVNPMLSAVAAKDAPLPSTRTVDEAMALLAEMEKGALILLSSRGLPDVPGLYRRDGPGEDWRLLQSPATVEQRWSEVLSHPPEAGFRYLKLGDVVRAEHPHDKDLAAAAAVLDRTDDLRELLARAAAEEPDGKSLLMFWSAVELMVVLFAAQSGHGAIRKSAQRALEWEIWRREALEIWKKHPELSDRATAKRVVDNLHLAESHHSVRRRLSGFKPGFASREEREA